MGDFINIFEMSPRDGLQNEKKFIATKDKIKFILDNTNCVWKFIKNLLLYLVHLFQGSS